MFLLLSKSFKISGGFHVNFLVWYQVLRNIGSDSSF